MPWEQKSEKFFLRERTCGYFVLTTQEYGHCRVDVSVHTFDHELEYYRKCTFCNPKSRRSSIGLRRSASTGSSQAIKRRRVSKLWQSVWISGKTYRSLLRARVPFATRLQAWTKLRKEQSPWDEKLINQTFNFGCNAEIALNWWLRRAGDRVRFPANQSSREAWS